MIAGNLCNPFATAYCPLIESSLHALQTVILNCWPRIGHYNREILQGIAVCWCRIVSEGAESPMPEHSFTQLVNTLKILKAALKDNKDELEEIQKILECDCRLVGLL